MGSVNARVLVNVRDSDLVRVSKKYRTVKVHAIVIYGYDMFGCGVKVGTENITIKFSGSLYARVSVSGGVMVRVMVKVRVKVRVTIEVKVIFQVSLRVIGRVSFRVMDARMVSFSADLNVLLWVAVGDIVGVRIRIFNKGKEEIIVSGRQKSVRRWNRTKG